MKDTNLNRILADLAEDAAPSNQIDLWPTIKNSLTTNSRRFISKETNPEGLNIGFSWLYWKKVVALMLMLAFAVFLAFQKDNVVAQKFWQFFHVTDEKSFSVSPEQFPVPTTPTPVPTLVSILPLEAVEDEFQREPTKAINPTCSLPAFQKDYYCQIRAVEDQAGFNVKEFVYDPKGTEFSRITFDLEINQATTEFVVYSGGGLIRLRQGIMEFLPSNDPWSQVPVDAVDQVLVNGNYAEIAKGTYVVYPNASKAVWEPGGIISLVWRDGNNWYVLEKLGDPYPIEWITKNEMVKLAESLVDERPFDSVPPQDPENLKSITAAEELAGFDVVTPTLLPIGYEFKRAVWTGTSVGLFYGSKTSSRSSLSLFIMPVEDEHSVPCSECPAGTIEVVNIGKWMGWYWRGIFHSGPPIKGQPAPTPAWKADAGNWELFWRTDQLQISMSFWPSPYSGEQMNKETMIAIAESME